MRPLYAILVVIGLGAACADSPPETETSAATEAPDAASEISMERAPAREDTIPSSESLPRGSFVPPADTNSAGRWTPSAAQLDSVRPRFGYGEAVDASFFSECPPSSAEDSIAFGRIRFSDVTGDASGSQLVFRRIGTEIAAKVYVGVGGVLGPYPVGIVLPKEGRTAGLWYTSGGRTLLYFFDAEITCDAIRAEMRFRSIPSADYNDPGSVSAPRRVEFLRNDSITSDFPSTTGDR